MPSRVPRPKPLNSQPPGCCKCSAKRCVLCSSHLQDTKTFTSVRTGHVYTIRDSVGCKSSNIIYLIDCNRCHDVQYVGETGNTASKRFHGHRSNIGVVQSSQTPAAARGPIRLVDPSGIKRETLVARHFQGKAHKLEDMRVTVIELIRSSDIGVRKRRERFWRHKLRTNYPDGLNVWD